MKKGVITFIVLLCVNVILAQTTIKGSIYDIYLEPVSAINISTEKGTTTTDEEGGFTLTVKQVLPLKITVSGVGYQTQEIEVVDFEEIDVVLEKKSKLQEIVISASRTPERVLESPVTIERIDASDVKRATSVNFYEDLANLKGIDVLNSSSNVKNIVSNRGFANTENTRFVQLVDGIESTLPLFNYSLGNSFGISELDIATAEVLPGASSALYGPNALNGILLMNSKNPFDYQGISTYAKTGVTTQDDRSSEEFYDVGIRMAYKFSDKFAAKANFTYQQGEEWHATDTRNVFNGDVVSGDRENTFNYDGVNVYGDDVDANLVDVILLLNSVGYTDVLGDGQGILKQDVFLLPNVGDVFSQGNVGISRRGYNEVDLIDTGYKSANFSGSLNYRPWANDKLEIIYSNKFSLSDNIVHGSNRLKQTDGISSQYALEFKGNNFFVKGYYTKHKTNLVDPNLIARYVNNSYLPTGLFFAGHAIDYVNALIENNGDVNAALITAGQSAVDGSYSAETQRLFALNGIQGDTLEDILLGAPKPGTERFETLVKEASSTRARDGGAFLEDESAFYHIDANYNFKDIIKIADIQVGGSFRDYQLNSNGNFYTDATSSISFNEFGIYTQVQKKLADDRIKLALTGRYDKSDNFNGKFSPRASITYAAGATRNHNFRLSYQTAFRNPTTQDQYGAIELGNDFILGTTKDNLDRFSIVQAFNSDPSLNRVIDGEVVVNDSFTSLSVQQFLEAYRLDVLGAALDPALAGTDVQGNAIRNNLELLETANVTGVKPETVQTLELGYRGTAKLGNNVFEIDASAFYSVYEDLITQKTIVTPFVGSSTDLDLFNTAESLVEIDFTDFTVKTNSDVKQRVYGFSTGFSTTVFGDFNFGANYAFTKNDTNDSKTELDEDIENSFNTPEHSVKVSFGHDEIFKNFGFNINARWQDAFLYNSVFVDAVIDSRTVLDAQINYAVPSIKSTFKLGGTNIGGDTYTSVPGSGLIGSQYYVSWTLNN